RKVHEERFIGRYLRGIGNETDRFVDKFFCQVIAFFRRFLRLDDVVVVDQFGVVLVRVTAQEAVVALEAAA
ncbi:MAG: hypothetical protein WBG94_11120, partial [Anaerolineales bacterium]